MSYSNKKQADATWQQFLAVNGSWSSVMKCSGYSGLYWLTRNSDYKDHGGYARLMVEGDTMTLEITDKASKDVTRQVLRLRHNVAKYYKELIRKYCDCIDGYSEWESLQ